MLPDLARGTETDDRARLTPGGGWSPFGRAGLELGMPARFAAQVRLHGPRPAVRWAGGSWTYGRLASRAWRIAHAILGRCGDREEPVAILLPQGPELIAAILGALAAGKIYVALDPAHSPFRNRDALADCSPALLLGRPGEPTAARDFLTGDRLLDLAAIDERAPSEDPRLDLAPDRLAYIYYTSGSTGRPKGVADCHRNVLHNILRYTDSLMIGCEDRLTLLQSCAYSGAVSSLFAALLNGASSHLIDLPAEGVQGLARRIEAERITMFHGVPAIFRALAATDVDLSSLRVVRLEGDLAGRRDAELFQRRFGRGCMLVNGLGATETGLTCQYFLAPDRPLAAGGLPVGHPTADVEIAILGEDGSEAAPGVIGEVEVRSRYLAVGYWGDPARTAERFGGDRGGVRRYRSGDLGRRRSDGAVELLGRKDLLVKLNGAWVDLGAVEQALLELDGGEGCRGRGAGDGRRADGARGLSRAGGMPPPDPAECGPASRGARRGLPAPTRWRVAAGAAQDANGKIDRARLPAPADRLATTDLRTPAMRRRLLAGDPGAGSDPAGPAVRARRAATRSPRSSWRCCWSERCRCRAAGPDRRLDHARPAGAAARPRARHRLRDAPGRGRRRHAAGAVPWRARPSGRLPGAGPAPGALAAGLRGAPAQARRSPARRRLPCHGWRRAMRRSCGRSSATGPARWPGTAWAGRWPWRPRDCCARAGLKWRRRC